MHPNPIKKTRSEIPLDTVTKSIFFVIFTNFWNGSFHKNYSVDDWNKTKKLPISNFSLIFRKKRK